MLWLLFSLNASAARIDVNVARTETFSHGKEIAKFLGLTAKKPELLVRGPVNSLTISLKDSAVSLTTKWDEVATALDSRYFEKKHQMMSFSVETAKVCFPSVNLKLGKGKKLPKQFPLEEHPTQAKSLLIDKRDSNVCFYARSEGKTLYHGVRR